MRHIVEERELGPLQIIKDRREREREERRENTEKNLSKVTCVLVQTVM